jgi:hypothetical protein
VTTTDTITLGAQTGDPKSSEVTVPQFMPLRELLSTICKGPYSSEVDEFALILRIDGEIWSWDFEGCQKLRRSKKERYITIDIGVPRRRWEDVPSSDIRKYLAECVETALLLCIDRLRKDKVDVNADALMADYRKVKTAYIDQCD